MNTQGAPCTIRRVQGEKMEECPFTDKRIQFENEFANTMKRLSNKVRKMSEDANKILKDKKSINKSDRNEILSNMSQVLMEIESNIPFVYGMFNEQMDKTVSEARGEFESFVQNKVNSLGIEALKDHFKMLENL